jgi:hypothetical protein
MSTDELEQEDILLDLQDAFEWIISEDVRVTIGRINRVRKLLNQPERTIE